MWWQRGGAGGFRHAWRALGAWWWLILGGKPRRDRSWLPGIPPARGQVMAEMRLQPGCVHCVHGTLPSGRAALERDPSPWLVSDE